MIVAERKAMEDIKKMIAPYKKLLVAGCGTCTTVCWAGGEKEVGILASQLRLTSTKQGKNVSVLETVVERQCEKEMVEQIRDKVDEVEAVVSLGCGAGAQTLASIFEEKPVFPGLNTSFIGIPEGEGLWNEMCGACGDCFLGRTGGICPVVRCAKGLLNGPCGGTARGGKCETDREKDCAWVLIFRRFEKQGRLNLMREYQAPKNFRAVKRPGRIQSLKA